MKNIKIFLLKIFIFAIIKISTYIAWTRFRNVSVDNIVRVVYSKQHFLTLRKHAHAIYRKYLG